ncbi:MAG: helix-turn-helix domain-containing protein [Lutibacter sp.]
MTLEQVPEAVQQIQADISEIKRLLNPGQIPAKEKKRLMILPEAAEFLNLSKPTIYRHVSARSIPFHKQGSRLYFIEVELLEWVKSGRKNLGRL